MVQKFPQDTNFFLAAPMTCGSSQARNQTHTTAVARAAAVKNQILHLLHHKGTSGHKVYTHKLFSIEGL